MSIIDYVIFDPATGELLGGYGQEVRPEHMDIFIQVTAEQRENWTSCRANATRDGIELIPYTPPVQEVPSTADARSFRLALLAAGLLDDFRALAMAEPVLRIEWETLAPVRRGGALGLVLHDLGQSSAQIDAIFLDTVGR